MIMNTLQLISIIAALTSTSSFAQDPILRPYQSIRSSGMGGLKLTTGQYDENVFGNPARATANPASRFTVFDLMVEANSSGISNAGDLIGAEEVMEEAADTAGENNHLRVQTSFPGFYKAPAAATESEPAGKMAWSLGLFTSSQVDLALERSFDADIGAIVDAGLHGNVARKFMENDALSVGINTHLSYRGAMKPGYGLVNLIKRDTQVLAAGGMVDFDLGGTYQIPFQWEDFSFEGGLVISNILDGKHTISQSGTAKAPPPNQPRAIGFGISARRASLWQFIPHGAPGRRDPVWDSGSAPGFQSGVFFRWFGIDFALLHS
jgi:hypothetical protein